jgi:AcrR family transcriptional regulator
MTTEYPSPCIVNITESWSKDAPGSSRRLLLAAVETFARSGYHGATTRQIATRAGMSPGAMYVHYSSKAELLYQIALQGYQSGVQILEDCLAACANEEPAVRLRRYVERYTEFYAYNVLVVRVVQYELRAIEPNRMGEILALRRRVIQLLEAILQDGLRTRAFRVADVHGTCLAVLSMITDIARWYSIRERMSPSDLATLYGTLVTNMVVLPAISHDMLAQ